MKRKKRHSYFKKPVIPEEQPKRSLPHVPLWVEEKADRLFGPNKVNFEYRPVSKLAKEIYDTCDKLDGIISYALGKAFVKLKNRTFIIKGTTIYYTKEEKIPEDF